MYLNEFTDKMNHIPYDSELLVAVNNQIFVIYNDYTYYQNTYDYLTIGSGKSVASGSLFSTKSFKTSKRLKLALAATAKHNPEVSKRNDVMVLDHS